MERSRSRIEVELRLYVYAAVGLLFVAGVISFFLKNWDVLIGVSLGLAVVFASDLVFDWSARYSEETERHREKLLGKKASETTYYYFDEDGDESPSSDSADKKSPRG